MKINVAHLREKSTHGDWIDFAVFDACSNSGTNYDNADLLEQLTFKARNAGLKIDKAALAYRQNRKLVFYGTTDLVEYLSKLGLPRWTHKIDV